MNEKPKTEIRHGMTIVGTCTGKNDPLSEVGCLDATIFMPAGACRWLDCEQIAFPAQQIIMRDGWIC